MELGTFGAILRFAMELEEQAGRFYKEAGQGELEGTFDGRAQSARKRLRRLERARREMVSEMLLESISDLDSDDYTVVLDAGAGEGELLRRARYLEATCARFYRDAAAKMPIREVVRLFERLARENEQRLTEHR